jgi:prophage endopeptidase
MPNELELASIAAIVGALLGGAVTGVIVHKFDGVQLAEVKQAHSDELAKINATAAQQLADAIAKGQVAQGKVQTLQQQYETEIASHAKDVLSYRAQLLAGTQRVRVHVASCHPGATSKGAGTPGGTDEAPAVAELSPAVAAGIYAVADDADALAIQLRNLQQYVKGLQDDGYIVSVGK